MDMIYLNINELDDYREVQAYFDKDLISVEDLLEAFNWELERQKPKEPEWTEEDKQWAYECEQAEERELQNRGE